MPAFFLIFFFFLLIILFLFFISQFYNIFFRGYAPFVSSKPKVIQTVLKELTKLKIKPQTIYELGAGRAGFLRAARQRFPQAKLVGIEYSFLPLFLGKIQSALTNSKIEFIKKNIFTVDLGPAEVIYCYLNVDMMKRLEPILKKECRMGTIIISYQFPLPHLVPIKTISLNNDKDKIYFYKL